MKFPRVLALLSVLFFPLVSQAAPQLGAGESLTYRVSWGIFVGAGEIKVAAERATQDGGSHLQVTTTTATRGLGRVLYSFDANAESIFDLKSGRLEQMRETSKSSKKQTKTAVTFDYNRSVAHYTNSVEPAKTRELPMPVGEPLDLIVSLVQTRGWDMKPGDTRDALVLFDDDFYELTIHAIRYEDVRTPLGSFKTLLLEPRMDKTPPKGMFKRGSGVSVWISQDERRLPVKFQVEFKFGTGVAALSKYEPPSVAKAAEKPAEAGPNASNPRS